MLSGLVRTFTSNTASVTVSQPAVADLNSLPQAQAIQHDALIPPMYEYDTATGEMRVNGVPVPVVQIHNSPVLPHGMVPPPKGYMFEVRDGIIDYGMIVPIPVDIKGDIKV